MSRRALLLGAGFAAGLVVSAASARAGEVCGIEPVEPAFGAPQAARHLREERKLTIVVLGSSSTLGTGGSSPETSFPSRLAAALAARLEGEVRVVNKGAVRQTAADMLARFERDVLAERPGVLIWEVGIADATRGSEPEAFAETVQAGIDAARAAGIDLVLMDMQFSRQASAVIDFQPYLFVLDELAAANEIPLFPRYRVMQALSEAGFVNLGEVPRESRAAVADRVYDCIGQLLARFVERALALGGGTR